MVFGALILVMLAYKRLKFRGFVVMAAGYAVYILLNALILLDLLPRNTPLWHLVRCLFAALLLAGAWLLWKAVKRNKK